MVKMNKNPDNCGKKFREGTKSSLTKKLLSLAMSAVMLFVMVGVMPEPQTNAAAPTVWDGTYDVDWYDSELEELHIGTAEELAGLSSLTNAGRDMSGQTIILDKDIILNDISDYSNWDSQSPANNWTPINCKSVRFNGIFDGGGHTITGLYCYGTGAYGGLFGDLGSDGVISNISCEYSNININNGYSSYNDSCFVGGICGYSYGKISNCIINNSNINVYKNHNESQYNYVNVGGICGENNSSGEILNCINNSNINSSYNYGESGRTMFYSSFYYYVRVGGICGDSSGKISNCINKGKIDSSKVSSSSNRSKKYSYSGGIIGSSLSSLSSIENCYNQGDVSAYSGSTSYAGGILGYDGNSGKISNVYNTGKISGATVGCILGYYDSTRPEMTACYYLINGAQTGIGSGSDGDTIGKSNKGMQTQEIAQALGDAFVYNPGGYPMLAWEITDIKEKFNAKFETDNISLTRVGEKAELKLTTNYTGVPIWVSDNPDVVTVENGVVTAVSNGTATIHAICGEVTASCKVTVTIAAAEYSLNRTEVELFEKGTFQLKAYSVENYKCTWLSLNNEVAKVDSNGIVTGVSEGNTLIYAIFENGKTLTCNVSVKKAGLSGDINKDGSVSVVDVFILQKYIVNMISLDKEAIFSADTNSDGKVNVIDVVILKRIIMSAV